MKTSALVLGTLFSCFSVLCSNPSQPPIEIMSDITNDFGVCVLQLLALPQSNAVVSPYGLVSVALLLYEGSNGVSAAEFYNTLHLPWHRDITRLGFRDLHNYLKSYFTSDGFLRGLILNRSNITLRSDYINILKFYGFQPDAPFTQAPTNTTTSSTTSMMANETTTTSTTTPSTTTTSTTTPSTTTTSTTTPSTTTTSTTTPATTTTSTREVKEMISEISTSQMFTSSPMVTIGTAEAMSTAVEPTTEKINTSSSTQELSTNSIASTQGATTSSVASTQGATTSSISSTQEITKSSEASTQEVTTSPLASTQDPNTIPVGSTQEVTTSLTASTQEVNTTTIVSTQDVNTSPITSTQEINTSPSTQELSTNSIASTQGATISSIASTQEVTTTSEASTQEVISSPIASTQDPNTIPVGSTQEVTTSLAASTQEVNTTTIVSTQDVNTSPVTSTQEITTSLATTVKSDITENTLSNTTETMSDTPDMTVSLEETSSNEGSIKPSSRLVSFTTSDIQSTKFFSPSSSVENFQQINDRTTTSIDSGELLTSPFVSDTTGTLITTSNINDVLIISPPPDPDILPLRDMPMLDALMLGLNQETLLEPLSTVTLNILSSTSSDTTDENLLTKRSTVDTELTNSQINNETIVNKVDNSEPLTSPITKIDSESDFKTKSTESVTTDVEGTIKMNESSLNPGNSLDVSTTSSVTGSKVSTFENVKPSNITGTSVNLSSIDDLLAETVTEEEVTVNQENDSFTQSTINSVTEDQENIITSNLLQSETNEVNVLNSDNLADPSLLTILSDSITFPNKSRQKRYIYGYQRNFQYGNWISHRRRAPWFQSSGEQWFSTYTGKKLAPMLTYTAYLPFSYISSIGASALELPLDDLRYSLLILLPNQNQGLKDMLNALKLCPLRYIVSHLKHTPVYAVVPIFTIVKHINLTPVLQVLGIRNVFDAFQANLTNMSDESNLYVRSIEQVITVSVRKYYNTSKWINAYPSQIERHFVATRPFAFFVIDSLSKVSLLAGTIVDPLFRSS